MKVLQINMEILKGKMTQSIMIINSLLIDLMVHIEQQWKKK